MQHYVIKVRQLLATGQWFSPRTPVSSTNETDRHDITEMLLKVDTQRSASYLDLHLEIDNGGRLKTKLYDKRDDFTFISSNIPASSAYGVYIS